jgi:hypothetical protein
MASFLIQTIKFEFKLDTWTNQSATPSYWLSALVVVSTAIGTNPADSNGGGTARPRWPIAVQAARASTSLYPGDTDHGLAATDPRAVGSDLRWNQPKRC